MATTRKCPALQASWLNGWLAAVGVTVLDSRIKLHWTESAAPVAVLSAEEDDPFAMLKAAWPTSDKIKDLPIAEHWREHGPMKRKVKVDEFASRVSKARAHEHSWTLSSTMTDLHVEKNSEVIHAKFDPPVPKGITLHSRLLNVYKHTKEVSLADIRHCFTIGSHRVKANGLGFDQTRLGSLADDGTNFVDPIVEVLAFYALRVFPVRGAGPESGGHSRQRGWRWWRPHKSTDRRLSYFWPAWGMPLDLSGVDALLDAWIPDKNRSKWELLGVHAGWRAEPYKRRGKSSDVTTGFGSTRL